MYVRFEWSVMSAMVTQCLISFTQQHLTTDWLAPSEWVWISPLLFADKLDQVHVLNLFTVAGNLWDRLRVTASPYDRPYIASSLHDRLPILQQVYITKVNIIRHFCCCLFSSSLCWSVANSMNYYYTKLYQTNIVKPCWSVPNTMNCYYTKHIFMLCTVDFMHIFDVWINYTKHYFNLFFKNKNMILFINCTAFR